MPFKYLVAIDFECTCFMSNPDDNQKIIEFAAAVISLENGRVLHEFREVVRQNVHLSSRCSEFTGVTQADISSANSLNQVMINFDAWLKRNQVHPAVNRDSAFVTWTDNDLVTYLPHNCQQLGMSRPNYFNKWIDLNQYTAKTSLEEAIRNCGLQFQGKPHRALNDAINTSRLGFELNRRNALAITSSYP